MHPYILVPVVATICVFAAPTVDANHLAVAPASRYHHETGHVHVSPQYDNIFVADSDAVVMPPIHHVKRWGPKKHKHTKTVTSTLMHTTTVKEKLTATLTTTTTAIPAPITKTTTVREMLTATLTTTTTTTTATPVPITKTSATTRTVTFISTTPLITTATTTFTSPAPAMTTILTSTVQVEPKPSASISDDQCSDEDSNGEDPILRYGHRHHHASDSNYHDYDFYYNYVHNANSNRESQASDRLHDTYREGVSHYPRSLDSISAHTTADFDTDCPSCSSSDHNGAGIRKHDWKELRLPDIDLQNMATHVVLNDDNNEALPIV